MRFVGFEEVAPRFTGKRVAVVGSAPSVLYNLPGIVDAHDVVVRVNNYKLSEAAGFRCDVHYSFYGGSIRKAAPQLVLDGVTLCMCKCPNSKPIESAWHEARGKQAGIDFRKIYQRRADWWFCDTYVPSEASFMEPFKALDNHVPTSGFAAIYEILKFQPSEIYLTGFDFFSSGVHNVDERWRPGDASDPIGHVPEREAAWLAKCSERGRLRPDRTLATILHERSA